MRDYYADSDVRSRIREYCGASQEGAVATAAYVASLDRRASRPVMWQNANRSATSDLDLVLMRESDIARSLLDRENLVFVFEIDYMSPDSPQEPFIRPAEILRRLEPTYQASCVVMKSFGIQSFKLVTGRGYHFTGLIPLEEATVDRLADVVPTRPDWLDSVAARQGDGPPCAVSERVARAWTGLGCVVEYLASLIARAARTSTIPVVFNGTHVGIGPAGRASASLDFSYVGDPLDTRYVRSAFSLYQWHRFRPDIFGTGTAEDVPPLAAVPRGDRGLEALMRAGRSLEAGCRAARNGSAVIPDVTTGIECLLVDYRASPLAAFHQQFYEDRQCARPNTARTPTGLPPCVVEALRRPNDLLLKPEHLQHLVRTLLARGWSAAKVAGLVRAAYVADHGWGDRWTRRMDATTRAEFDVRVFAGQVLTGGDRLVDFNCVSAQEKNLCPNTACQWDLRNDRARLLRR